MDTLLLRFEEICWGNYSEGTKKFVSKELIPCIIPITQIRRANTIFSSLRFSVDISIKIKTSIFLLRIHYIVTEQFFINMITITNDFSRSWIYELKKCSISTKLYIKNKSMAFAKNIFFHKLYYNKAYRNEIFFFFTYGLTTESSQLWFCWKITETESGLWKTW